MIAVEIAFLTGRFHATPWGRHVNEGAVEWPISQWRLLRTLTSVWYHKAQADVSETQLREILEALSSLPVFDLPPAVQAHTRHYMPLFKETTTKVLDTFLHVADGTHTTIAWPDVVLSPELRGALALLLDRIGYLGRAESWVDARLLDKWDGAANSWPISYDEPVDGDRVRLLASEFAAPYAQWREKSLTQRMQEALESAKNKASAKGKDASNVKLTAKEVETVKSRLPTNIFEALHADTGDLRKDGWSQPPGSRWVEYVRSKDAFEMHPGRKPSRRSTPPTVARYALAGNVLPNFKEAVSIGERVRVALMSRSKNERGNASPVFSGKTDTGDRLDNEHTHAHIFPEANGAGGKQSVSHVTVYAPMGFSDEDQNALRRFRKTWGQGGHDIQFVFLGFGKPADFGGLDVQTGATDLLPESKTWISRTPFILTRHAKAHRDGRPKLDPNGIQIDGPEFQLRKELARKGLKAIRIEPTEGTMLGGKFVPWRSFRRQRLSGAGSSAGQTGYGFKISFREPVPGPIALGYGRHFGLGQFVAFSDE